jgi:hypothetical protein
MARSRGGTIRKRWRRRTSVRRDKLIIQVGWGRRISRFVRPTGFSEDLRCSSVKTAAKLNRRNSSWSGAVMSTSKGVRGRPVVHTEPWGKITVVLLDRHVAYLDRLAIDIRLKHGRAISRAEIIRALIEAAEQSGIDLSEAYSIDTLVDLLNGWAPKRKSSR